MRCLIVIPARMGSTRFPGKPLCDLLGKPMVRWVYEASVKSGIADQVIVATPDEEIVGACAAFGAEAMLTRHDHVTGTDRIAEVAAHHHAEVYVNVQGDEPLIRPESIATCARTLLEDTEAQFGSVYCTCETDEYDNPAVVKVVLDKKRFALYFSRYPIPFPRNERTQDVNKHIGLYAYRQKALMDFATWKPTPLEQAESLEQLRFMENGIRPKMSFAEGSELAVDTPEQAEEVRQILSARMATSS
jgi:3-deoxy-manno-octulosonate cytidylyltransferase (CMP-KDO synthetase)